MLCRITEVSVSDPQNSLSSRETSTTRTGTVFIFSKFPNCFGSKINIAKYTHTNNGEVHDIFDLQETGQVNCSAEFSSLSVDCFMSLYE